MSDADVLIVGGGVIGLSIAYELARRDRAVLLVDRQRVAGGATAAAAGMLAAVSEAEEAPSPLVALGRESLRRYPEFVRDVEQRSGSCCGYRGEGTLWVALDRDEEAELGHLRESLAHRGLAVRPLSARELLALEPHLTSRVLGGLRVEGDHQVDPRALCRALACALQKLGGRILEGHTVDAIEHEGRRVAAVSGRDPAGRPFRIGARTVVLAAGAWSEPSLSGAGPALGVRPVKGQLLRLRGQPLLRHVVRTPHAYLVPRVDGELLVGATVEEQGFDLTPTAGAVMDLLRQAWRMLPAVYELELSEVSVGLRAAVPDQLPVIGPARDVEGLVLAVGHYRNGVLLAPATAQHVAEWLCNGTMTPALEPFLPARLCVPIAAERS
jgi:glycine oxidase